MARQTTVVLTDDTDGSTADETVSFALDGTTYEIDLSHRNAAALRDLMGKYAEAGRKVTKRGRPKGSPNIAPRNRKRVTTIDAIEEAKVSETADETPDTE